MIEIEFPGGGRASVLGGVWASEDEALQRGLRSLLPTPGPEDGDPDIFLTLEALRLFGGGLLTPLPRVRTQAGRIY